MSNSDIDKNIMKKKSTVRVQALQDWIASDPERNTFVKGLTFERKDTSKIGSSFLIMGIVFLLAFLPALFGWIEIANTNLQILLAVISAVMITSGIALKLNVKDIDYMLEAETEIERLTKELGSQRASVSE